MKQDRAEFLNIPLSTVTPQRNMQFTMCCIKNIAKARGDSLVTNFRNLLFYKAVSSIIGMDGAEAMQS